VEKECHLEHSPWMVDVRKLDLLQGRNLNQRQHVETNKLC
jgi:hypothetical protein